MFSVSSTKTWPRVIMAVGLPFVLVGVMMIFLVNRGLPWYGWVTLVVAVIWLAWSLVQGLLDVREIGIVQEVQWNREPRCYPKKPGATESVEVNSDDLMSLVYFLDEAREPTLKAVRRLLESVFRRSFDEADETAPGFLTKLEPAQPEPVERFSFRTELGGFCIISCSQPYIDHPEEFARRAIRDKRLRMAIESHAGWVSIDYAEPTTTMSNRRRSEIYGEIGQVASALAGPDCLAIYCPELHRCNEFSIEMIDELKAEDPLRVFAEPTHEPVIEVSKGDPRMVAAVKEAVDRWPEFVAAFEKEGKVAASSSSFIVKAEFGGNDQQEADSEFMWMSVIEVTSHQIRGRLMNEPHQLENLHRGQEVVIDLSRLNDWICPGPGETPLGGFTLAVLSEDRDGDA